jgi:hypothetical protein
VSEVKHSETCCLHAIESIPSERLFGLHAYITAELWKRFPELQARASELAAGHENEFEDLAK